MSIEVHHEPKDDAWLPPESCCACRKPTRYWYGTGPSNVALCQQCAPNFDPADLPSKAQWMAGATAKLNKRRERKEKQA